MRAAPRAVQAVPVPTADAGRPASGNGSTSWYRPAARGPARPRRAPGARARSTSTSAGRPRRSCGGRSAATSRKPDRVHFGGEPGLANRAVFSAFGFKSRTQMGLAELAEVLGLVQDEWPLA